MRTGLGALKIHDGNHAFGSLEFILIIEHIFWGNPWVVTRLWRMRLLWQGDSHTCPMWILFLYISNVDTFLSRGGNKDRSCTALEVCYMYLCEYSRLREMSNSALLERWISYPRFLKVNVMLSLATGVTPGKPLTSL